MQLELDRLAADSERSARCGDRAHELHLSEYQRSNARLRTSHLPVVSQQARRLRCGQITTDVLGAASRSAADNSHTEGADYDHSRSSAIDWHLIGI